MSEGLTIDAGMLARILSAAKAAGADEAEVYAERSRRREAKVYEQSIEGLTSAESVGFGVRALVAGRVGYAYGSDPDSAEDVARMAVDNAAAGTPDAFHRLAEPGDIEELAGIYDPAIEQVSAEDGIRIAMETEAAAIAVDPRVKGLGTTYSDGMGDVHVKNTRGVDASYKASYAHIFTQVAAGEGAEAQTAWWFEAGRAPTTLDPKRVGRVAAERVVELLGARKIASCTAQILLPPLVAGQFLALVSQALNADSVQKGRSLFAGKVGQRVASDSLTVSDDGRHPDGFGSAPFDDEGTPTGRTPLIESGMLVGFMHDCYTAAKAEAQSTGNASRGSYKSPPGVGVRNLLVEPGSKGYEEMVESMTSGLIVYEVSGMHAGANPISGEVSIGAGGMWVEDGKPAFPVREVTIGGNLLQLLQNIEAVGSDLTFVPMGGSVGTPSILISGVTVGGE